MSNCDLDKSDFDIMDFFDEVSGVVREPKIPVAEKDNEEGKEENVNEGKEDKDVPPPTVIEISDEEEVIEVSDDEDVVIVDPPVQQRQQPQFVFIPVSAVLIIKLR